MRKTIFISLLLLPVLCVSGFPQQDVAPLSVLVKPGFSIPIGQDAAVYNLGGGGTVSLAYDLLSYLNVGLNSGYTILPVDTLPSFEKRTLSMIHFGLQAGTGFEPFEDFRLSAYAGGGWYYGFDNRDPQQNANNPFVSAGLGASYRLIPSFSIGIDGSYRNYLGQLQDVMVHLGGTLHVGAEKAGSAGTPPNRNLELLDIELDNIFPVFYGYYDENPLGIALLVNTGNRPVENIRVTFFVPQYMEKPKECLVLDSLDPDQEKPVPFFALFNDTLLNITEGTKVSATIIVESESDGKQFVNEKAETLRLYDRNAMTWDDTAKAASFVTAKDPDVLRFSKNISGMVKDQVKGTLNQNIVLAMALFHALQLYGISYEIDPSSAYEDFSKNSKLVDYLQFPIQTLDFRAGDCDDLSILYTALLESVGIETAFITIPGHIYMAFSTGMSSDEAGRLFNNQEELIFVDNTAWMPVEVTALDQGYVRAWKLGAAQWQENHGRGLTELVPIRGSWNTYNAVGYLSGQLPALEVPEGSELLPVVSEQIDRFVESEIFAREQRLEQEISATGGSVRSINKLGVLYARFGLMERAQQQFERILKDREYLPALMNLGMILYMSDDFAGALGYFQRADRVSQDRPSVLLSLARTHHELGNYGEAKRSYERLQLVEPEVARRYAYLDLAGSQTSTRAASADEARRKALWEEE
jgi:tetratricopeptide (TPR) repeat protein